MADIQLAVEDPNSPTWLPAPHAVVTKCRQHGPGPSGFVEYSPDFVEPSPDCTELAWIKYVPRIAMGEARTQAFIANIVNSDKDCVVRVPHVYFAFRYKRIGYIIMQHIHGHDCNEDNLNEIARAVKRLLSIKSETRSPGPVRGGPVAHRFFADHQSDIRYNSVSELQEHVNNILAKAGYPCRVDFNKEDSGNLSLCLDGIHPGNFRKDTHDRLFALDFGKTNFLPSAFQDLAFADGPELAMEVGESLGHSVSKHRGL
ncbi:hypothetical protein IW262DRAFT_1443504 [Armillaria fumosa]|nr:hypothetical protein IW262DRAFT_1443504 [Armillaria fumosa]